MDHLEREPPALDKLPFVDVSYYHHPLDTHFRKHAIQWVGKLVHSDVPRHLADTVLKILGGKESLHPPPGPDYARVVAQTIIAGNSDQEIRLYLLLHLRSPSLGELSIRGDVGNPEQVSGHHSWTPGKVCTFLSFFQSPFHPRSNDPLQPQTFASHLVSAVLSGLQTPLNVGLNFIFYVKSKPLSASARTEDGSEVAQRRDELFLKGEYWEGTDGRSIGWVDAIVPKLFRPVAVAGVSQLLLSRWKACQEGSAT